MKKLLLVDDDQDFIETMSYFLTQKGYDVTVADNGKDAFSTLKENKPDLILLDIMMAGVDGLTTCHHLKTSEMYKKIPIMILTAKGQAETKHQALSAGANDFLSKPFDFDGLILKIEKLLSVAKGQTWFSEQGASESSSKK